MSHFSVAVVTATMDKDLTELTAKLAPYHEYECTGHRDEYVVEVDKTDEMLAHLNEKVWVEEKALRGKGTRFKRKKSVNGGPEVEELGDIEYRTKWSEDDDRDYTGWVEIPRHSYYRMNGKDPIQCVIDYFIGDDDRIIDSRDDIDTSAESKHNYGFVIWPNRNKTRKVKLHDNHDGDGDYVLPPGFQYIDITNPNKQWDWWSLGGRYNGALRTKRPEESMQGRPGIFGGLDETGGKDYVKIADIDFEGMKLAYQQERRDMLAKALERIRTDERLGPGKSDEEILADYKAWNDATNVIEAAGLYKEWRKDKGDLTFRQWVQGKSDLPEIEIAEQTGYTRILQWDSGYEAGRDREEWALDVPSFRTFAFIDLEGKWNQKGDMGWWGIVTDAKNEEDWSASFDAFLSYLIEHHGDKYLAVVDCHI